MRVSSCTQVVRSAEKTFTKLQPYNLVYKQTQVIRSNVIIIKS